jgi:hypothetical protein
MPYYNHTTREVSPLLSLGLRVDKTAAALSGGADAIFYVAGGAVLMTGLLGKITVASGANACVWTHVPTTGTTQPIAASLDINPALVGDYLTITGLATDAMTYNASAAGMPMMNYKGVVLPIGTLTLTSAANDGAASFSIWYVPLEDGAYVTSA